MQDENSEDKSSTGRQGEDAAARYLERHGCKIVARNWRAAPGEVDIVAECPPAPGHSDSVLAFVEVRTRHGRQGLSEESITRRKAFNMASAAYAYMTAHDLDPETVHWRIDLVAIAMSGPYIKHLNWVQGAIEE